MRKSFLFIVIVINFFFMFICYQVYASRPFSTEDATVTDKGAIETEFGFEYTRQGNKNNNYNFSLVPIYGLIENVEISVELPFDIIRRREGSNEEGLSDISLVAKTMILPETEKIPSLLLKTIVKLTNGDEDKGLGSGDEDVGFIFAATKSIDPITIHGNIGYTFVGDDKDSTLNDTLLYGIALEYSLNTKLAIVGEIYGESNSDFEKETHTISPLIGLTCQLTEKITFDTAFKMGICDDQKTEYGIISGISISF